MDDIEYIDQEPPPDDTPYPGREWYPDLVLSAYAITRDWGRAEQVVREVLARALGRRTDTPPARLRAETIRLARVRTFVPRELDPYLPDAVREHETVVAHHLAGRSDAEIAVATDTREEEVAAALAAVRAATPPPEHPRLRNRLRQQRTRRKTLVGAAVAVLLAAVAVPMLRESAPKPASDLVFPPPTPARTSHIHWADFADREHGYALRFDCAGTVGSTESCIVDVLATEDGEHWTARRVPRPERDGAQLNGFLKVLGPRELVVDWQTDPTSTRVDRMHSSDGGRHWERVDIPASPRTTPAVPDGGSAYRACARTAVGGECEAWGVGVVLPGSGETALLATQPALTDIVFDPTWKLAGDRWWAIGHVPGTGGWAIAITADAGRTWWTTPIAPLDGDVNGTWSIGGSGQTLYAAMADQSGPDALALAALYRSDDGGRSWTRTWQHREGQPPMRGYFGALIVKPDGTLLLNGIDPNYVDNTPATTTYVSVDRGVTFTRTISATVGYVYWTGAGFLSSPLTEGDPFRLSTDGTSWEDVVIG